MNSLVHTHRWTTTVSSILLFYQQCWVPESWLDSESRVWRTFDTIFQSYKQWQAEGLKGTDVLEWVETTESISLDLTVCTRLTDLYSGKVISSPFSLKTSTLSSSMVYIWGSCYSLDLCFSSCFFLLCLVNSLPHINYLPGFWNQVSEQSNLRKKGFVPAHSWRSSWWGRLSSRRIEEAGSTTSAVRKLRGKNVVSQLAFAFWCSLKTGLMKCWSSSPMPLI